MNATLPEIPADLSLPELVTATGVGLQFGLPASTAIRRLEKAGIKPDAFLKRGHEAAVPLFLTTRLVELEPVLFA
ncbi:MAG: hypothetical protein J0M24_10820 [Verrucomicrobia bacterium]|nr:hypothetical protein [Verrucomicrobiota bacterium]